MRHKADKHWVDVGNAIREIDHFTVGKIFSDYQSDRMLQAAIERELEIIGEALNRLEDMDKTALEKHLPEYRKIIGLRNVLAHGYDVVDNEIIWDLVKNKIPELKKKVNELV
jgi:uncharacterized protein with HEPN domain